MRVDTSNLTFSRINLVMNFTNRFMRSVFAPHFAIVGLIWSLASLRTSEDSFISNCFCTISWKVYDSYQVLVNYFSL
jgi:hypothetical protein